MNYGLGSYTQRLRQIRNSLRMAHQKELDPKNPREKQPAVSEEVKAREQVEKLAKGEDPIEEKSKGAVDDHDDVRDKTKKEFSSPKQLP